jgi:hypothetical protein
MLRRSTALFALCAALLAQLQCKTAPTTVLLELRRGQGLPALDHIKLSIFDVEGATPINDKRIPKTGKPELPDSVVLYPKKSNGELRIFAIGIKEGAVAGEGVTRVTLVSGTQVRAVVVINPGTLADSDGDEVPDAIDNCPKVPNPSQGPCTGDDGGPNDGPADLFDGPLPDLAPDLPIPDIDCDVDKDTYISPACGGDDCDDGEAKVNPGETEGPPGSASCSDSLDNDCDGNPDLKDTDCVDCKSDADCDDNTVCTADTCEKGLCKNAPVNEGMACTSDNKCVENAKCTAGKCTGQAKTCTPSGQCKVATCNPAKGCGESDKKDGTSCSDSDPCTDNETCQSGVCVTPPQNPECYIGGTCYADGDKSSSDSCQVCDTQSSTTSWTLASGYCFIWSNCYADGYKQNSCRVCDVSNSTSSWTLLSGWCRIGGTCYQKDATGSGCQVCDPSKSTSEWSIKPDCGIVLVALNNGHTGNLGGLSGANSKCQTEATAAGLTGTYKAFVSTSTQNVKDLISTTSASQPVYNSQGQELFSSWTSIFTGAKWDSGENIYSFDGKKVDEGQGASPEWDDAVCWHGSKPDGTVHADTCTNWTVTTGNGAGGEVDLNQLMTIQTKACTTNHAVICVRVP